MTGRCGGGFPAWRAQSGPAVCLLVYAGAGATPPWPAKPALPATAAALLTPLHTRCTTCTRRQVILDERQARDLIPLCKRLGATGIFTYAIQVILH